MGEVHYVASGKEKRLQFELLQAHLSPDTRQEGSVIYEDGWSDERVAAELRKAFPGSRIRETAVGRSRLDMFGPLIGRRVSGKSPASRLDRIEQRFNALCDQLGGEVLNLKV